MRLLTGFIQIKAHSTITKAVYFDVIFLRSYIVRHQSTLLKITVVSTFIRMKQKIKGQNDYYFNNALKVFCSRQTLKGQCHVCVV